MEGRRLAGRYRLTEMVGSGGAGNVWAAVDEVLGRRVAVKDVGAPPWLTVEGWEALRERTLREARAAAVIGHPNVVTIYDVVEEDSRPWIVMQLVEAKTLSQIIEAEGPCPPQRVAEIGLQVLAALQAAHDRGILHRDVKPSNVLVCEDGRAVLTDFGIATVDGDAAITASGVLVGAPAYIAPERVQGGTAGPASDLWSLGATLYTAVEGRPPYRRDSPISTIAAVVHDEPEPVTRAGVLAPLLESLLRRDPEQRPNAAEVERFLRRVASAAPGLGAELAAADVEPLSTQPVPMVPAADTHPTQQVAGSRTQRPADRRMRMLALTMAAATALLAIVASGFVARQVLDAGTPRPSPTTTVPGPAGPNPVLDVQVDTSAPRQNRPAGVPGVTSSETSTTGEAPSTAPSATTTAGPSSTPASSVVPPSTTQPPTTTAEPEPTTATTGAEVTGEAADPSVLP